jgi:hypothetical protein
MRKTSPEDSRERLIISHLIILSPHCTLSSLNIFLLSKALIMSDSDQSATSTVDTRDSGSIFKAAKTSKTPTVPLLARPRRYITTAAITKATIKSQAIHAKLLLDESSGTSAASSIQQSQTPTLSIRLGDTDVDDDSVSEPFQPNTAESLAQATNYTVAPFRRLGQNGMPAKRARGKETWVNDHGKETKIDGKMY